MIQNYNSKILFLGIILSIIFGFSNVAVCQTDDLEWVIDLETMSGSKWSMSVDSDAGNYELLSAEDVSKRIMSDSIDVSPFSKGKVSEAVGNFSVYCDELGKFLDYSSSVDAPVRYFEEDGKRGIVFSGVSSSKVYNSLRTNHKDRISRVLSTCITSEITGVYEDLKGEGIDYFAVSFYYGVENFADDTGPADAEILVFVVRDEVLSKFAEKKITQDELVDESMLFVKTPEMTADYMKVEVDL
jgi:hypothetical protein